MRDYIVKEKRGSLIIVGCGIKSVGHITFEAQGWIEQADLVLYCVADPATEIWIKRKSRKSQDLYALYGNDKPRIRTYNEMVVQMLEPMRQGLDVCAVFYGHPGVFVLPSHKAISLARAEGYRAAMLPSVSASDCLFADLGVDPATDGCQMAEATELLMRARPINTDSHVIIWQIGCVGDWGFKFGGNDNGNLHLLVEYLEGYYPAEFVVTHYQGSQYPMCLPSIQKLPLKDLRQVKTAGVSTLYIPPFNRRRTDRAMAQRLGMTESSSQLPSVEKQNGGSATENEITDLNADNSGSPLSRYVPTPEHSALADYIAELMMSPRMLELFNRNPEIGAQLYGQLTADELHAVVSRRADLIYAAIKLPQDSAQNAHPGLPDGVDLAGSNTACGLANVVPGVVKSELLGELSGNQLIHERAQVLDRTQLLACVNTWRAKGDTIVFTNGCFDILHVGHLTVLEAARREGTRLVVAINSDDSVRRLKGSSRPVIGQLERARLLAALSAVDAVTIFEEDTPLECILALRPDVLVKGGDYTEQQMIGSNEMRSWNGQLKVVPFVQGVSTTKLIADMITRERRGNY
jgi:rfaE bifunctional protein nucleotidyltransferase chain/domain